MFIISHLSLFSTSLFSLLHFHSHGLTCSIPNPSLPVFYSPVVVTVMVSQWKSSYLLLGNQLLSMMDVHSSIMIGAWVFERASVKHLENQVTYKHGSAMGFSFWLFLIFWSPSTCLLWAEYSFHILLSLYLVLCVPASCYQCHARRV